MKKVAKESLKEIQKYLGLNYTPVQAWVEDWEKNDSPHGVQSIKVEWSDGNQIHSIEANQNLNELVDLLYDPLEEIMTFREAAEKYDIDSSALRHSIIDNRFRRGEIRKSGGTWLVTREAMERLYGNQKGER